MAYKARYSVIAEIDLFEVIGELSRFYPSTPKKFKSALKKALSNAKLNPYMYKASPYNPSYRQVTISDYIVFYKVIETSKNTGYIEVYRILNGSRNIEQILD
jgi:plasmid stabilization system protein ParE